MADDMNIMTALYSACGEIESVEIQTVLSLNWCACEIHSYQIMFLVGLYSMAKLLEFREGYITSAMVSVDMRQILYVLRGTG